MPSLHLPFWRLTILTAISVTPGFRFAGSTKITISWSTSLVSTNIFLFSLLGVLFVALTELFNGSDLVWRKMDATDYAHCYLQFYYVDLGFQ